MMSITYAQINNYLAQVVADGANICRVLHRKDLERRPQE